MLAGKLFGIAAAVIAVIVFFLTEDMSLKMVLVDRWTLMMAVLFAIQCETARRVKKASENDEENRNAYVNA